MEGLLPYIDFMDEMAILDLWETCNEHGWFDTRRMHLDGRLAPRFRRLLYASDAEAFALFDDYAENKLFFADRWIEDCVKAGATLDELTASLERWLEQRGDFKAFRLVAFVILRAGRRKGSVSSDAPLQT